MKRAFTQKIGSVPSCASDNEGVGAIVSENPHPTSQPELTRRVKTSATTISLAIAMAASGMWLSGKHHKVMAAEELGIAKTTEVSPNSETARLEEDSPAEIDSAVSEKSIPAITSTNLSRPEPVKIAKLDEITRSAGEIQEPTPVVLESNGARSLAKVEAVSQEELNSASKLTDIDRENSSASSTSQNSLKALDEEVPQGSPSADAPKVIYQVRSGDTLQTIADTYDTSVDKLAKLNSLDAEAPLQANRGLVVPESPSASEVQVPIAESTEDESVPADILTEDPSANELEADMEILRQGTQVKTLVAQADPASVQIAVPEPDVGATASPLSEEISNSSASQTQSELATAEAIEIPVPKPENMSAYPTQVEIHASANQQPRAIKTQAPDAKPVSVRQADSLPLEAGAIEIPVPKPATNFVPNRSRNGRLATAPLGTDEYNIDIPAAPSREDLKERFLNPPANVTYGWPVNGVVTSGFGMRWGRLHAGIDFGVPTGTPVRAAAAGIIKRSGWVGGYGNLVEIVHPDGSTTRYGHNSKLMMQVGQEVQQGEVIALSGNTGRSTGPHVHFEIRPNGKQAVNPMPLLSRRA